MALSCPTADLAREAEKQAEIDEAVAEMLRPFEEYLAELKALQAQLQARKVWDAKGGDQ